MNFDVGKNVRNVVWKFVDDSVSDVVGHSVNHSVNDSVWSSVWSSVCGSMRNVVVDSMRISVDSKLGEYKF